MAHRMLMKEREEANRRMLAGNFEPSAWAEARKDIQVNYFLNSPDAETIEAEKWYIKEKALRNMFEYNRKMSAQLKRQQAKAASP